MKVFSNRPMRSAYGNQHESIGGIQTLAPFINSMDLSYILYVCSICTQYFHFSEPLRYRTLNYSVIFLLGLKDVL